MNWIQEIVASFRAAVVAALQGKDFAEAHAKSEEMARCCCELLQSLSVLVSCKV